jgi:hypothetical protein
MEFKQKIVAILIGLFFFVWVLSFVRKRAIRPSAVLLWMMIPAFLLSIPLLEPLYVFISRDLIGFDDSRHIVYIVLIGFLLVYSFYLTIKISKISDYVKTLIKELAILELEVKKDNKSED